MSRKKSILIIVIVCLIAAAAAAAGLWLFVRNADYGFAREVSQEERSARLTFVSTAEQWLGCKESDGSHRQIIDLYNSHEPLAMGYEVQYEDEWCATFVSAAAIGSGLTRIIPTECGCERQIRLFQQIECWEENDAYIPLPGDIIYYDTDHYLPGDCEDWSDHVGIVVGVWNNYIKVIEGNCSEAVRYRIIPVDDRSIRGFGLPDYGEIE